MRIPSLPALGLSLALSTNCAAPYHVTEREELRPEEIPLEWTCPEGTSEVVAEGQIGCLKNPASCSEKTPFQRLKADCAKFGERVKIVTGKSGAPMWTCGE